MRRVYLTTDQDGHEYIIPYELKDEFEVDLDVAYSTEEFGYFETKYGKYEVDSYDSKELYANI